MVVVFPIYYIVSYIILTKCQMKNRWPLPRIQHGRITAAAVASQIHSRHQKLISTL